MKKTLILLLILVGLCLNAKAQLRSEVNEGIELTSLSFRLAGATEYSDNSLYKYTQDIEKYFGKYKNHPLIKYCKEIRDTQLIGYDAVAWAGVFIEINDGKIKNLSTKNHSISSVDIDGQRHLLISTSSYSINFTRNLNSINFMTNKPTYAILPKNASMKLF